MVHQPHHHHGSPSSPARSHSPSPHSRPPQGSGYGDIGQSHSDSQHWNEDLSHNFPANCPYNYSLEGFGWGTPTNSNHGGSFGPRGGYSVMTSPHHLSSMSVNVSMNMTMHGVSAPGYDHVTEQWPQGKLFKNVFTMGESYVRVKIL